MYIYLCLVITSHIVIQTTILTYKHSNGYDNSNNLSQASQRLTYIHHIRHYCFYINIYYIIYYIILHIYFMLYIYIYTHCTIIYYVCRRRASASGRAPRCRRRRVRRPRFRRFITLYKLINNN